MKKNLVAVAISFLVFSAASAAHAQGFPYHLYETRTLAELIDLNVIESKKLVVDPKNRSVMLSANPFYSSIRLEYTGRSRPVTAERMSLFKLWVESLKVRNDRGLDVLSMIEHEFLFKECGKEYWLPVQKPAARDLIRDAEAGRNVTLYLMIVGGHEEKKVWDWVFFVNSFKVY